MTDGGSMPLTAPAERGTGITPSPKSHVIVIRTCVLGAEDAAIRYAFLHLFLVHLSHGPARLPITKYCTHQPITNGGV